MNAMQKKMSFPLGVNQMLGVIGILITLLLCLPKVEHLHRADITDGQWVHGISQDRQSFLIEKFPPSLAIRLGDALISADGDRRRIKSLGQRYASYWIVEVDAPFAARAENASIVLQVDKPRNSGIAFFAVIATIFALGHAFGLLGSGAVAALNTLTPLPKTLNIGMRISMGTASYLALWRALAAWTKDAHQAACVAAVCSVAIVAITSWRRPCLWADLRKDIRHNSAVGFLFLAFVAYELFYWFVPADAGFDLANPHAPTGPFEAGRYANIASFIAEMNRIPVVKQNCAQSLLTGLVSLLGLPYPHLSLISWLALAMSVLMLTIYGYCQYLGASRVVSAFCCLICLASGPRLTFSITQLTDNHSTPLLHNAYADTVFSMAIVLQCVVLFSVLACNPTPSPGRWQTNKALAPCAFMSGTLLPLTGPHNLAVIFSITAFFCGLTLYQRRTRDAAGYIGIALSVAAGSAVVLPYGGMLTPTHFLSSDLIEGLLIAPDAAKSHLRFVLNSSFLTFPDPWNWTHKQVLDAVPLAALDWHTVRNIFYNIDMIEGVVLNFGRSMCFPLVGLVCFYFISRQQKLFHQESVLLGAAVAALVAGGVFACAIEINRVSWEMLRFLNVGYLLAMLVFALAIVRAYSLSQRKTERAAAIAIVLLSCTGPCTGIGIQIASCYSRLSITEKIAAVVNIPRFTSNYDPHHQERCFLQGRVDNTQETVCRP
jgi:hypothetical protein